MVLHQVFRLFLEEFFKKGMASAKGLVQLLAAAS